MCGAMANPSPDAAWAALDELSKPTLLESFEADPGRLELLSRDIASIHFDWSKMHLDRATIAAFDKLAEAAGYAAKRDALFAGEIVNATEQRPATHVAERGEGKAEDNRLAAERHGRMRSLVYAI